MHLIHTSSEKDILQILQDGSLKSSYQTGNIKMFGHKHGSKYIYLRLGKAKDFGNFVLDSNLLLENNFYLKTGWSGEAFISNDNLYKGKDFNSFTLKKLISKFNVLVNKYYKKKSTEKYPIPIMMSNEILVKKKIPLKKFLIQINLSKYDEKIIKYVEKNYPNTKIFFPK